MISRSHRVNQRVKSDRHSHSSLVASLIIAGGIVVLATAAVGASGGFTGPKTSTITLRAATTPSTATHLLGQWVTPHDQTGAPTVPTAGGAIQGLGSFNGVSCPTSSDCIAVGGDGDLNGVVATSQDQGGAWTQGVLDENTPELNAVDCASVSICVAVGQGATVRSSDGGTTWTTSTIPTSNTTLISVSCPSASTCVSVGVSPSQNGPFAGQLLLSSDGGVTWSVPSLPNDIGALGSGRLSDVDVLRGGRCVDRRQQRRRQDVGLEYGERRNGSTALRFVRISFDVRRGGWKPGRLRGRQCQRLRGGDH